VKLSDENGGRYVFFCGVSGAVAYSTGYISADDEDTALAIAKREAREYFNRCARCGAWVCDAAYNIDEGECVLCAPFTAEPRYCSECGRPVQQGQGRCPNCGKYLR